MQYRIKDRPVTVGDMRLIIQIQKEGSASDATILLLQSWLEETPSVADVHAMPLADFYTYFTHVLERLQTFQQDRDTIAEQAKKLAGTAPERLM